MLLNAQAGSFFFLGELLTDLKLVADSQKSNQCGACQSCLKFCPTGAIVAPYQVDARRCISYLTIEHHGAIPIELRSKMGNRIYGCDDCQLVCPFNKAAEPTTVNDFSARHSLNDISLLALFNWNEQEFLTNFEGSPIRRIGYQKWVRNIAVALGNAPPSDEILAALKAKLAEPLTGMVVEHIQWAIKQQQSLRNTQSDLSKLIRTTSKIVSHLD